MSRQAITGIQFLEQPTRHNLSIVTPKS